MLTLSIKSPQSALWQEIYGHKALCDSIKIYARSNMFITGRNIKSQTPSTSCDGGLKTVRINHIHNIQNKQRKAKHLWMTL